MSIRLIAAFLTDPSLRCDEYGSERYHGVVSGPRRNHVDAPPEHQRQLAQIPIRGFPNQHYN